MGCGTDIPSRGVGFLLGKNDLIRLSDCFAFGMKYGYRLTDKIEGCPITGGTWGLMNGCSADFCAQGLDIRGENNLSVSGGTFWDHEQGLTVYGPNARIRISACEFKSNGAPAINIRDCDHTIITAG